MHVGQHIQDGHQCYFLSCPRITSSAIKIRFHVDNAFESYGHVTIEGNFVKIGIEFDGKKRT
jgi:hypothetical protein